MENQPAEPDDEQQLEVRTLGRSWVEDSRTYDEGGFTSHFVPEVPHDERVRRIQALWDGADEPVPEVPQPAAENPAPMGGWGAGDAVTLTVDGWIDGKAGTIDSVDINAGRPMYAVKVDGYTEPFFLRDGDFKQAPAEVPAHEEAPLTLPAEVTYHVGRTQACASMDLGPFSSEAAAIEYATDPANDPRGRGLRVWRATRAKPIWEVIDAPTTEPATPPDSAAMWDRVAVASEQRRRAARAIPPDVSVWAVGEAFTIDETVAESNFSDDLTVGKVYTVTSVDAAGLRLGFIDDAGDRHGIGVQYVDRATPPDVGAPKAQQEKDMADDLAGCPTCNGGDEDVVFGRSHCTDPWHLARPDYSTIAAAPAGPEMVAVMLPRHIVERRAEAVYENLPLPDARFVRDASAAALRGQPEQDR